jgi:hypothetical protein
MAYLNKFPERLIFYCDIPSVDGRSQLISCNGILNLFLILCLDGETPLLFSNDVIRTLREINPSFIENLLQKGVRYIRRIASKHSSHDALKYQKGS